MFGFRFSPAVVREIVAPLVIILLLFTAPADAQDTASSTPSDKPTASKGDAKKPPRAKARGRLPNYFAKVVTPEQREDIYDIQVKYAAKIKDLEEQLIDLKLQQFTEIHEVLTKEQLDQIKAARAEAAAKRRKATATTAAKPE